MVIPTLAVLDGLFGRLHGPDLLADPRIAPYLDATSRHMLSFGGVPLGAAARFDLAVPAYTLGQLREAGVTILAGNDASKPDTAHGPTFHLELELLVRADLLLVEGDPARDIGATRDIAGVWQAGHRVVTRQRPRPAASRADQR